MNLCEIKIKLNFGYNLILISVFSLKRIIPIVIFLFFFSSCKQEKALPKAFDYGVVENNIYKNRFFNFSIPINKNWTIQNKQQIEDLKKQSGDVLHGGNKKLKKEIDASMVNVAELLMVSKYEIGTPDVINPTLLVNVESLASTSGISTIEDYLFHAKNYLAQLNMEIEYKRNPYDIQIGDEIFKCMEVENLTFGIHQDYYVTLRRGFALAIFISYVTEENKDELFQMIEKIQIEKLY